MIVFARVPSSVQKRALHVYGLLYGIRGYLLGCPYYEGILRFGGLH